MGPAAAARPRRAARAAFLLVGCGGVKLIGRPRKDRPSHDRPARPPRPPPRASAQAAAAGPAAHYRVFPYLVRSAGREADSCVESSHPRERFPLAPVVQDEGGAHGPRRYLVFPSRARLWAHVRALPPGARTMHEVIPGGCAQRIKLDLDVPGHALDALSDETLAACLGREYFPPGGAAAAPASAETEQLVLELLGEAPPGPPPPPPPAAEAPEAPGAPAGEDAAAKLQRAREAKMAAILDFILDALLAELYHLYYAVAPVAATRRDLAVADSSGATREGFKFSYHVLVLTHALADNEEAAGFTAWLAESLPAPIRGLLDRKVNSRLQHFRLALCEKPGSSRPKLLPRALAERLGTAAVGAEDTLVLAPPEMRVLPRLFALDAAADGGGGPRGAAPPAGGLRDRQCYKSEKERKLWVS